MKKRADLILVIAACVVACSSLSAKAPPLSQERDRAIATKQASTPMLEIFNINVPNVTTLINGEYEAGFHSVNWDASDYASGVYFYRLTVSGFVQTKKMLLIK